MLAIRFGSAMGNSNPYTFTSPFIQYSFIKYLSHANAKDTRINKKSSSAFSMESAQQCYRVVRTDTIIPTLHMRTERFRKFKSLPEKSHVRGLALVSGWSNSKSRVTLHYSVRLVVRGV